MLAKNRPIVIIDDDEDDLDLFNSVISDLKIPNEAILFNDGQKAIEFIKRSKKPFLFVLCDINMPRLNGLELRRQLYTVEELRLKSIPFLFFSTSGDSPLIRKAYDLSIQGYFTKPSTYDGTKDLFQCIINYWECGQNPNVN